MPNPKSCPSGGQGCTLDGRLEPGKRASGIPNPQNKPPVCPGDQEFRSQVQKIALGRFLKQKRSRRTGLFNNQLKAPNLKSLHLDNISQFLSLAIKRNGISSRSRKSL